ncbi:carboxypeptidase-like regulatory domain-containing protein [Leptospira sp. 85282-16]|uniref:carboxypeptidase-like regulatory domain-containing protein n=1 Tax=Leptospira sp. 85282-16 TaxID=2971256 RepID=UPI0021C071DF|nr:carboxypeptidase-like regulatory domain-containing protein [Leptospira sp. 85282-16]MCT8334650.1 carboxypeptidase-like regulatory domain-containing protein [Leptospira sp. 85282-16]
MKRIRIKPILLCFVFLVSLTNCYFNPFVFDLLNPEKTKDNSSVLGMIAGLTNQTGTVQISGQLKKGGAALSNVQITLQNVSPSVKSQTNSSTTNSSGRFFLDTPTGIVSLQFSDSGTIVNFQLEVSKTSVTLVSIDKTNYQVQSFEVYELGVEPPAYFELIASMPYDGLYIDKDNFSSTIGSGSTFLFSDNLEELVEGTELGWAADNFIVTPAVYLLYVNVSTNYVHLSLDNASIQPSTTYTVTLNPGIKSKTGKSLKQSTFQFKVGILK